MRLCVYGLLPNCKGKIVDGRDRVAFVYPACLSGSIGNSVASMKIRAYRPLRAQGLEDRRNDQVFDMPECSVMSSCVLPSQLFGRKSSRSDGPLGLVMGLVDGDSPGDPGEFIGQGDGSDVYTPALYQSSNPLAERISFVVGGAYHGPGTMDEQASEIRITAFADAEQGGFTAGGMLSGNEPEGRCCIPAPPELTGVTHASTPGTGYDWAEPGNG